MGIRDKSIFAGVAESVLEKYGAKGDPDTTRAIRAMMAMREQWRTKAGSTAVLDAIDMVIEELCLVLQKEKGP